MTTRIGELESLVWPLALLVLLGLAIILRSVNRARYISLTASPAYITVPIQVLTFKLAPLNVDGSEIATDQLTARSSMVVVSYGYQVDGKAYSSETLFPMSIEWLKPRVPPLRMMDDLESGRLRSCHVNVEHPEEALPFVGWSPYLRSHVLGVGASGLFLMLLSASLYWFI